MTLEQFAIGEGKEKDCSFFALYAGLRMYMDYKAKNILDPGKINISSAEAYTMLMELNEEFPGRYEDAKKEYDSEVLPLLKKDELAASLVPQMTGATIFDQDFIFQNGKWFYTLHAEKHGPFKTLDAAFENFDDLPI